MSKVETSEEKFNIELLVSIFRTSKKTIQEYVAEIDRYNRFKSVQHEAGLDGCIMDNRGRLMDLYDACVQQDAHLAGVIETLESQIIGERYMMCRVNEKGKYIKDIDATEKMQGSQFDKLIRGIMEAKLYGYTGFEILPEIDKRTKKLKEINLIERRNILADQRRIVKRQGIMNPGWSFDDPVYEGNYVLVNSGSLGLFSATTPLILAKKFTLANYVNFSHTYGQPIIHGKSTSEETSDRKRLANDIASAAQNKVIVTGREDEIDIKTFTMSNSERIFTGLMEIVDRDVSNLILGSESMAGATMSYVGATKAHQDVFRDRVEAYRRYIENVMNEEIVPRLVAMGYLAEDLVFKYAKRLEMSDQDQIQLYDFLTEKYEISPDEIEKTFGVVVGKQINVNVLTGGDGGGGTSPDDRLIMSDEEYYKRYGHRRGEPSNFFKGRR